MWETERGRDRCVQSIIFSGCHEVFVCVWEYLDGSVSVFLYFREKMVSKETVLQVVMVSRYVLIVVHVCHVHMTLYSEHLCLFLRVILGPAVTLVSR